MSSTDALDNNPIALLSDVTLTALQLSQQPFGPVAPDALAFSDDTSEEQLADLKQALITGDDLLLILGELGAGKSTLLTQLGANSGQRIQCFAVKGSSRFSTLNLFAGMLEAFKQKPPELLTDILDELIPCLQMMGTRKILSAIILDDADLVEESELTQLLIGMQYLNGQDGTLMRVALAAPPSFEDRIPDLLPEAADLSYSSLTIEGLSPARSADYLQFRLLEAGYTAEPLFTDQNIESLVQQTEGLPGGLQNAAAYTLNLQYDPSTLEYEEETKFLDDSHEPWLQTRKGKFGLGALAMLLIVGGLMMFMPDAPNEEERYNSAAEEAGTTEETELASLSESESSRVSRPPVETNTFSSTDSDSIDSNGPSITINRIPEPTIEPEDSTADNSALLSKPLNPPSESTPSESTPGASETENERETASTVTRPNNTDSVLTEEPAVNINRPERNVEEVVVEPVTERPITIEPQTPPAVESPQPSVSNTPTPRDTAPPQTAPPISTEVPDMDPELTDILESPTWVLVQNANQITVQMIASHDRQAIEAFLKRNRSILAPPNSIYSFERNGKNWYALLHGLYPSFAAAQDAVEQMPDSALTDQPWIRNIGRVQEALKAQ